MAKTSSDVTIARWRMYGRDRLYVARADGTKVGYWDLVTDTPHPEKPALVDLLEAAYVGWTADRFARTSEETASIA
jgi:hypothetical protein